MFRALVASGIALVATLVVFTTNLSGQRPIPLPDYCRGGQPPDLPLPSSLPLDDYEEQLYDFLFERAYVDLSWCVDRQVRDTGPFILESNYGTHPAVRIFYSPGVMTWLRNGREGEIPDGAMIIKEMFASPAARYEELRASVAARFADNPVDADAQFEAALQAMLEAWTVLVKDKSVSKDGWFWANPAPGSGPDSYDAPFNFPASGAGLGTCLRCHASAESEATFASLSNIKGFEQFGDPLRFRVDNAWRTNLPPELRPAEGRSESELIANLFQHLPESHRAPAAVTSPALPGPDPAFLAMFTPVQRASDGRPVSLLRPAADQIRAFPGQWADHVPAAPNGAEQFITSDNCLGCHGGLGGAPSGVTMFVQTGPNYGDGFNVSEFGEWRWSPMGLAGRDPIFFAQLESEFAILAQNARDGLFPADQLRVYQQAVANTCLSCHGAMGQRQLEIDVREQTPDIDDPNFYYPDYTGLVTPLTAEQARQQRDTTVDGLNGEHSVAPYGKYGNLAREGISCTVCHHIDAPTQWTDEMTRNEKLAVFLSFSTTGVFPYSPPDELNGPFDDVKTKPMEHALGIEPKENPYIQDSKMCGTCHAINLPNVDAPTNVPLSGLDARDQEVLNQAARNGAEGPHPVPLSNLLVDFQHSIEQATYLEWENSDFAWDPNTQQSCQDCHMPGGFRTLDGAIDIAQVSTQIATIQDSTYADVEHDLSDEDIDIPVRDDYRRHELVGLNVFLVEMFNQFDQILGVDQSDYMTSATNGDELAIENMVRQARDDTVALDLAITSASQGALEAAVRVTNKVGHRLPSGVGFRRVFLELLVTRDRDGAEDVVWGSGRTNSVGVIVDEHGVPLDTEFFDQGSRMPPAQCADQGYGEVALYQEHHQVITAQNQVQIYEELVLDADGQFTTSFIHRDCHPKDNRLIPFGTIDPETEPREFQARFGDSETIEAFMKATVPEGAAADDPDFGPGQDTVRYQITLPQGLDLSELTVTATMYSQAIPPYWLRDRFRWGSNLPPDQRQGTERLYYLTSHLNTEGTPIENWKLPLVSVTADVSEVVDR
jgi:hypothetical protein